MNARDVLGIIYNSKSGNTSLKWRQIRRMEGKVTGEDFGKFFNKLSSNLEFLRYNWG